MLPRTTRGLQLLPMHSPNIYSKSRSHTWFEEIVKIEEKIDCARYMYFFPDEQSMHRFWWGDMEGFAASYGR